MKKKHKIYLPLLLGLACAVGILLGAKLNFAPDQKGLFSSNSKKEKLNRLIDYIDYEYIDEVNTDSIVDVTVNRILENLDPHSVYIPKNEYAGVTENMKGDFVGIGVSFYNVQDTIVVIQAMTGGPSEKLGIRGGDRILYANDKQLFDKQISNDSIIAQLKGTEDSRVTLTVLRKGLNKLLKFNVKRSKVPLKSVDAAYMLNSNLGYIKVNRFSETTYKEFKASLHELKNEGATQIAIDLRDNPGGYLSEAINIVDEFLEDGQLILFTKNKKGTIEETFSNKKGAFEKNKLFVLINENSASASEIVAGAFQDNDRGTIVGRRSYGKGLVQREMELGDGSAVRLTIARYYTPTGRSIQKSYEMGNEAYFNDYILRYKNGEMTNGDSIHVTDSLRYETPGGKIVYGGGGIIPDIFVAKDTNMERENITYALRMGLFSRFVFEELEKNRSYYNGLSWKDFYKGEIVTDSTVENFLAYMKSQNVPMKVNNYQPLIKKYIKAVMAEQLFGTNEFQRIINENDRIVDKVIELSLTN
ncbi:carboxyl-terminal processing protease [Gillisia sp. Hel_I_86]|uniref:S41 family peptidase n=1 Tax=Gillisia sp. Hel_I_86 TaxID=1249981 RepID=UPI0011996F3B|nr:S41 family peptidase [Gillisia sp. Hel_I_86]TVZ26116.1 carboxyl-terminal processing protease [Gillisia sp. Hel_I_86]